MKPGQPIISTSRVEAYFASALRLLGWLLGTVLRLSLTGRSAKLSKTLTRAERTVECILFLKAVALFGPPPKRTGRLAARRLKYRRFALLYKGARVRARKGSALQRILALIDALACPERAVAYFLKRISKGLRFNRWITLPSDDEALVRDALELAYRSRFDTS